MTARASVLPGRGGGDTPLSVAKWWREMGEGKVPAEPLISGNLFFFQDLATKISTLFSITSTTEFGSKFRCKILKEKYISPDERMLLLLLH